jgi:hypothetical protein
MCHYAECGGAKAIAAKQFPTNLNFVSLSQKFVCPIES